MPFYAKKVQFTKTGSGQTHRNLNNKHAFVQDAYPPPSSDEEEFLAEQESLKQEEVRDALSLSCNKSRLFTRLRWSLPRFLSIL